MACEKCADLCLEYEILSPGDLRKAFAVVGDHIADGTIQAVFGSGSHLAFARKLAEGGPWPDDRLSCQFVCRSCREVFNLDVDAYHGRGAWTQASAQNKWRDRIIGDAPPLPGASITMREWLKQHQVGFVSIAGLIAFLVVLFVYLR